MNPRLLASGVTLVFTGAEHGGGAVQQLIYVFTIHARSSDHVTSNCRMINSKPPEHETAQIVNISEEGAKHLKNRSRPQPAGRSRRADGFASVFLSLGLAGKVLVLCFGF